ncbi:RNA polymerase sigma-70 factor (ECF subfamily) [Sphingobacterium allocomposti]|jgi:RNA polymerase sigma factor (sigma-70 family)|uniref:RNA polymerase sigma-70 factor (ECF subfamily) n=1 Tax=Sphingobacterium allocomposti TaxID=415956 RepID=A0A5S5DMQ9_9SPHI|nr:sigma-70 family RNA polymerase sigma factor [Sphingobacterium composti Yoo et al. 2007 non Ten et al. 2007]TYP95989.1 RNA polymerase sigma-70 factor (ECF subfamily) [Sphingobacterium composti Yoo et al. 2007 non Ten et al. 2007]HLS95304.1 sigma-70 family RNA polymerase sigma factor [Sphingobacterium sp.]
MNEKELLTYYRRTGDIAALGRLYAPYMPLLYGVCFKYLQDQDASQDAVMQIFEQLIDKLKVHEVDSFKSWLYVFARNFCLMELRNAKRKTFVDIEEHLFETEGKMEAAEEKRWKESDFEKMEACLASLQDQQAKSIRLFYLEQKCYKEIAEEMNVDLNKVKSYIQNGKRNLKICMEKRNNGK